MILKLVLENQFYNIIQMNIGKDQIHSNKYSNHIQFFYTPVNYPSSQYLQNLSLNQLNTTSRTSFSSFSKRTHSNFADTTTISIKRKNQIKPTTKINLNSNRLANHKDDFIARKKGIRDSFTNRQFGKEENFKRIQEQQDNQQEEIRRMSETLNYQSIRPTFRFSKYFGLCGMERGQGLKGCQCFQQPCQWSIIWTKSYDPKNSKLYKNLRQQSPCPKTLQQIQKDLPRTYPDCPSFSINTEFRQKLGNILLTYSIYDHQANYTQGMNMIAAVLLYHIKKEEQTFWAFVDLMDDQQLRMIYLPGFVYLKRHAENILTIVKSKIADLYSLMEELDVSAEVFLYGWLLSLMSNCVPLEYMHLVVEKFRVQGWSFIYKLIITFLLFLKNALLMSTDCSQFYSQISNTNSKDLGIHWHEILQNCYKVSI